MRESSGRDGQSASSHSTSGRKKWSSFLPPSATTQQNKIGKAENVGFSEPAKVVDPHCEDDTPDIESLKDKYCKGENDDLKGNSLS